MSCNWLNIHRYISVFRVCGKVVGTGHRSGGEDSLRYSQQVYFSHISLINLDQVSLLTLQISVHLHVVNINLFEQRKSNNWLISYSSLVGLGFL